MIYRREEKPVEDTLDKEQLADEESVDEELDDQELDVDEDFDDDEPQDEPEPKRRPSRIKRAAFWLVVLIIVGAGGFFAGLASYSEDAPQISGGNTTKVIQQSTHVGERTYDDHHLDFSIQVPLDWLHRYSAVQSGTSVSFAFETAASPGGTTKLQMAEVFTVYKYGLQQFNDAGCGCTELGRSDTSVYAYKFDGATTPLVAPLTPATIRKALIEEVTPTFTAIK